MRSLPAHQLTPALLLPALLPGLLPAPLPALLPAPLPALLPAPLPALLQLLPANEFLKVVQVRLKNADESSFRCSRIGPYTDKRTTFVCITL